ncbi:programmed cell death protein 2 [Lactifluus subvellereus]|nr:programmed cell death protein 2 [Lactifluus subvellereus]
MASSAPQEWSDSDDDDVPGIETSVLLGIPDGPVESASDLKDAAVSRIGGVPALLSHRVPFDSTHCQHCKNPMELLVQLWAPLEDSPYDRSVYVWGCAKSGCQRKSGSVRAWRGLRYNESYASKLERKLAQKREHEQTRPQQSEGHAPAHQSVNPFAVLINQMFTKMDSAPHLGLGSDLFNSISPLRSVDTTLPQGTACDEENLDNDDGDNASVSSLVVAALASATLAETAWQFAPSYPPQYLSTIGEYLSPPKETPAERTACAVVDGDDQESHSRATEKYENSMHTDHIFDRFSERTAHEPQQCVRYDLGGIPVPFASDGLYKQLFPLSSDKPRLTTVTKATFSVQHQLSRRGGYDESSIPPCPHCGSRRIFECQLMPNLLNILSGNSNDGGEDVTTTDEQRKEAVQKLLKGNIDGRGMEWGTILVFSCEKDCCLGPGNKEKQDTWNEELVLVHWDD